MRVHFLCPDMANQKGGLRVYVPDDEPWWPSALACVLCVGAAWGGVEWVLGYVPRVKVSDLLLLAGGVFGVLAVVHIKNLFGLLYGAIAAVCAGAAFGAPLDLEVVPSVSLTDILLLAAGVLGILTVRIMRER